MRLSLDWKFMLPLIVSVLGVLVTVLIWQADLNGKSLSVKLVSRASLEPTAGRPVPEMEISIDGAKLLNPYVVTFEITNEGRKPIPSGDFESPIEIRLESATLFVRPKITGSSPKDIDAELAVEPNRIGLKPVLLNPQDSVVITAITTGEPPAFSSKARISGISSIPLLDGTQAKKSGVRSALLVVVALFLFLVSGVASVGSWPSKGVWIAPLQAAFIQMSTSVTAAIIFVTALAEFGVDSLPTLAVLGFGVLLVSSQLGSLWVEHSRVSAKHLAESNNSAASPGELSHLALLPPGSPPLTKLTLKDIGELIEGAVPLQREMVQKSYIGLGVVWDTVFQSGSLRQDNSVCLTLKADGASWANTVWCEVPLSEYPELGTLRAGAKIRVSGEIAEATQFNATLKDAKLYIYL